MKNKFHPPIFITFIFVFSLLLNTVQAIGFGSSQKNTYYQVKKGETAEFMILFWNVKNSSIPIRLKVRQVPEDMSVIIRPEEFTLNFSKVTEFPAESGRDYVDTQYGLMKTTPVKVLVKVSDDVELGEYDVLVDAIAGKPTTGVSTLIEKTFKLSVNVTSLTFFESLSKTIEKLISGISDIGEGITGIFAAAPIDLRIVLLISSMIGVFVASWIIYKHVLKSRRINEFLSLFLFLSIFFTMMSLGFSLEGKQVFLDVTVMKPRYSLNGSNSTIYTVDPILLYTKWDDNVNLSYAILSTNETSTWRNYTDSYGSPKTLTGISSWSNFTWQNTSLTGTKTIAWKIYANDTEGYENVTSEMTFLATYYLYDIVVVCQQDIVNAGQSISADITVTNNGAYEDDIQIEWWIEDVYGTTYTSGSTVVNISHGESWVSTKSLLVPSYASAGIYYYKVRVIAGTYSNIAYDTFEVQRPTATTIFAPSRVGRGVGVALERLPNVDALYEKYFIVVAGIPREYEVEIKNSGDLTLHNLSLYMQGLELSWYLIEPASVDLKINESVIFKINFIVPVTTQIKQYPVNILIKSEEVEKTIYLTLNVIELLGKTEFEKLRESLLEEIRDLEEQIRKLEERGIPIDPLYRLLINAKEKVRLATNEIEAGNLAEASILINEAKFILNVIKETITTVIPLTSILFEIRLLWIAVFIIIILAIMFLVIRKITSKKPEDEWSKLYEKWKSVSEKRRKQKELKIEKKQKS